MDPQVKQRMNPSILTKIAQAYGVDVSTLRFHDSTESFLYRYEKEGSSFFLRISHSSRRTPDMIRGEVDWLQYLSQFELPVVQVASNSFGEPSVVIPLEDGSFFTAVSFHQVPGKQKNDAYSDPSLIEQLGRIMGNLHRATQTYQPSQPSWKRPDWTEELQGFAEKYLPPSEQKAVESFQSIIKRLHNLPQYKDNYGLIHYDIHLGNFFVDQNRITLFDFDDCQYSWFVSDIAIALFYAVPFRESESRRTELAKRFLDHLLTGYEQVYHISDEELKQIPLFLKLREVDLYTVIYRSFGSGPYDAWCQSFMKGRKDRIEQGIPFFSEGIGY